MSYKKANLPFMYFSTRYIASSFKACNTALTPDSSFIPAKSGITKSVPWQDYSYNSYEYSLLNKQFIWVLITKENNIIF